jgi:hypothetical protein
MNYHKRYQIERLYGTHSDPVRVRSDQDRIQTMKTFERI